MVTAIQTSQPQPSSNGDAFTTGNIQGIASSTRFMKRTELTGSKVVFLVFNHGATPMVDTNPTKINPRPLPDHLYVDVPTITKKLSLAVFLICVLSLLVFAVTGFSAVQPIIAILFAIASGTFYTMAEIVRRSHHDRI